MDEIIISIIAVSIFLFVLFILLTMTTKRINILVKDNYIGKVQQFDYLISDREKKLNELNKNSIVGEKVKDAGRIQSGKESDANNGAYIGTSAKLRKSDILNDYKAIKSYFSHDITEKIKKFVELNPENKSMISRFAVLKKIRTYFSVQNIYKISAYQSNEQRKIVEDLLDVKEKEIVARFLTKRDFSVRKFVRDIDDLLRENDPMIYVYVGEDVENYSNIDRRIVVVIDKKIVEGVKIVYHGKVFDYSI